MDRNMHMQIVPNLGDTMKDGTMAPDKPDKHVDARMARIELAVQRMQLFIVAVTGVAALIWCLDLAERLFPEPDAVLWFYGARGLAVVLGLGIAYAVAKLIGYPLEVLKRA
jgi:hypothetical protein